MNYLYTTSELTRQDIYPDCERSKKFIKQAVQVHSCKDWTPNSEEISSENCGTVFRKYNLWCKLGESTKSSAASEVLWALGFSKYIPIVEVIKLDTDVISKSDMDPDKNTPIKFKPMKCGEKTVLVNTASSLLKIKKNNEKIKGPSEEIVEIGGKTFFVCRKDNEKYTLVEAISELSLLAEKKTLLSRKTDSEGREYFTTIESETSLESPVPHFTSTAPSPTFRPIPHTPDPYLPFGSPKELSNIFTLTDGIHRILASPLHNSKDQYVLSPPPQNLSLDQSHDLYYLVIDDEENTFLVEESSVRPLNYEADKSWKTGFFERMGEEKYYPVQNKSKNGLYTYTLLAKKPSMQISEHIEGEPYELDGEDESIEEVNEEDLDIEAFIISYICFAILSGTDNRLANFIKSPSETIAGKYFPVLIDLTDTLVSNNEKRDDAENNETIAPFCNGLDAFSITSEPLDRDQKETALKTLKTWVENKGKILEILFLNKERSIDEENPANVSEKTTLAMAKRLKKTEEFIQKNEKDGNTFSLQDFVFHLYPTYEKHWKLLERLKFNFDQISRMVGNFENSEEAIERKFENRAGMNPRRPTFETLFANTITDE